MKITQDYLSAATVNLSYEKKNIPEKSENNSSNSAKDIILSISRENMKSAKVNISNLTASAELVNGVTDSLKNNPENALLLQGNISSDRVTNLV